MNKIERKEKSSGRNELEKKISELGTKQMLKNQLSQTSYLSLFFSAIRFVGWKLWGIQTFLFIFSLLLLNANTETDFENVLKGITGLVLFSGVFFTDALFKSYTSDMWELEQTFKYDLRQHTTMKMLAFGSFDLLLIIVLSLFAKELFSVSFLQFALFLFVPFNIFCIVLFSVFTVLRKKLSTVLLWGSSGAMVGLTIILEGLLNVYELPVHYWAITCVMTLLGLVLLAKQMMKQHHTGGIFI